MSVGTGMLVMLLGADRILFSGASGGGCLFSFLYVAPVGKAVAKRHATDDGC